MENNKITSIVKSKAQKITNKTKLYAVKLWSMIAMAIINVYMLSGAGMSAFADGVTNDAGSFDTVVAFIVTWIQRIGYVLAFIGAVQFGFALKNDDADGKQRGLLTLASGFVVVAICIAYDQLFKSAV